MVKIETAMLEKAKRKLECHNISKASTRLHNIHLNPGPNVEIESAML